MECRYLNIYVDIDGGEIIGREWKRRERKGGSKDTVGYKAAYGRMKTRGISRDWGYTRRPDAGTARERRG